MAKIIVPQLNAQTEWFNGDVESLEIKKPLKTYYIQLKCPECESGTLEDTGHKFPGSGTSPVGYHHKCTKCGYICTIKERSYPKMVYEE